MEATRLPDGMNFRGRRVLVTGAASGIGQAVAVVLNALGCELVLADISPMDETRRLLGETGHCTLMQGNLADDDFVAHLVGCGSFYGAALVAGIFEPRTVMDSREAFRLVMETNVRSSLLLARACIEEMTPRKEGRVVIVGSLGGRNGGNALGGGEAFATYAASKGALHTLVKWLGRRAVLNNIMVNGVAPGMVETPMLGGFGQSMDLPIGRAARPEEIAWPIAFLLSPAASYISSVILDINAAAYVAA